MTLYVIPFILFCMTFVLALGLVAYRLHRHRRMGWKYLAERVRQADRVKLPAVFQQPPRLIETPSACRHPHIEPVIPSGETEPLAALCVGCLAEVPLEDWKSRNECSDCGWLDFWAGDLLVAHRVNEPCVRHR